MLHDYKNTIGITTLQHCDVPQSCFMNSLKLLISGLLEGKLDLGRTSLSHGDCISIGYFLCCVLTASSTEGFEVFLRRCSLGDLHINLMMKELVSSTYLHLTKLECNIVTCSLRPNIFIHLVLMWKYSYFLGGVFDA